jgi:DNA-binding transcriptional MerR regulator/effector-binding domain-containing protein
VREYLTIGEMAAIFNMDVQLLRHYDAQGLLVPAERNVDTGWRLYRFDQMYKLATIRYLRKLGYSLRKIDVFLKTRDMSGTIETLREQSVLLKKQTDELLRTDRIIQGKLTFVRRESEKATAGEPRVRTFPQRDYSLIGAETALFTHELFYFYPTVGFYRGQDKRFGAYLYDDTSNLSLPAELDAVQVSHIEAGQYLCGYHKGPYADIYGSIGRLLRAGKHLKLDGTVVTLNIIDQFLQAHPDNYLTELQVRILG